MRIPSLGPDGILEQGGRLLDHDDAAPFAIAASALLFGRALIVGGGRWAGPRACGLNPYIFALTVIEPEASVIASVPMDDFPFLGEIRQGTIATLDPSEFDSLFYDPYPIPPETLAELKDLKKWVVARGRLIARTSSGFNAPMFPGFKEEFLVHAGPPAESPYPLLCMRRGPWQR